MGFLWVLEPVLAGTHRNLPVSASRALELKVFTTTAQLPGIFQCILDLLFMEEVNLVSKQLDLPFGEADKDIDLALVVATPLIPAPGR